MSGLARVELEQDVFDAATKRAAEEGLSVTSYVSRMLRRSFERAPGEETVLVYDHVETGGDAVIDRAAGETDESHERRSKLYDGLFGRR
jgi:hypothetical protein